MARFELKMFIVEEQNDAFEAYEYRVMCHVKDIKSFDEVTNKAHKVVRNHIDESQNLIIVGSATIVIGDMDMLSVGFKNKDVDQEQVELVVELFGMDEEERTIH